MKAPSHIHMLERAPDINEKRADVAEEGARPLRDLRKELKELP